MNIQMLVITDGRRSCLERTLASAEAMLDGVPLGVTVINDACDDDYAAWLQRTWPDFRIVSSATKLGFGGAIQRGWDELPDCDFVFHCEDDFVFNRRIDLHQMGSILEQYPHVVQLVAKRQPWGDQEKQAGGIVECWPDLYEEIETEFGFFTQHRLFYSTNPSLYRKSLTTTRRWPVGERSERRFTDEFLQDPDARFAFVGRKFDPPLVQHIGEDRVGIGY